MTWFRLLFSQNRNAACGQYKEEILAQLREVAKIEPNLNNEDIDAEPLTGFKLWVPEQDVQPGHIGVANEGKPLVFPVFGVQFFAFDTLQISHALLHRWFFMLKYLACLSSHNTRYLILPFDLYSIIFFLSSPL